MSFDLGAPLRRIKPERRRTQLTPRNLENLIHAADIAGQGRAALLLDTNVYILSAAGNLPAAVETLLDTALLFHCAVSIAELATGIANADPGHAGWKTMRDHYRSLIASMPATRILTPDTDIWAEAGLIAGTLARTQNFQSHQRKECLNDALIHLTAAKAGLPVLTANRAEFDLIQQVAAVGQFIHF